MNNYSIQRKIPKWGKKTYVNWSLNPGDKALVFIHGFNGSSMETFGGFNHGFHERPEYKGYDVYFFSYDSLFSQIANSALKFLDFLKSIHDDVDVVVKNSGATEIREGKYSRIVIVAHSLGAVVARQALNEGYDDNQKWVDKCELILFAPAHNGARKEIDSFISFPSFLKCMGPLTRYLVVTLNQLMDTSVIIEPMKNKCEELIKVNKIVTFTIAKKVIWADPERVVVNKKFLKDPTAGELRGYKHTEVCKPHQRFEEPFRIVAEIL